MSLYFSAILSLIINPVLIIEPKTARTAVLIIIFRLCILNFICSFCSFPYLIESFGQISIHFKHFIQVSLLTVLFFESIHPAGHLFSQFPQEIEIHLSFLYRFYFLKILI